MHSSVPLKTHCPISDWAAPEPPPRGGRFASTPRFGRGGPDLGHLIHPRRNACAFRVRDFEQSTGLFNPALPDRASPPPTGRGPHGAGQRMQSIRVTDGAKACLRGVGASLPAPRFGRGGPCLGHLIHPRRNACAFRVRDFEQSTGLFNPASPDRLSPPPHTGRVSGCKASAQPTERRLAFAEQALRFPPLGLGAAGPV